jgi:hypothetical protein
MTPTDLLFYAAGVAALGCIVHGLTDWFSNDARIVRKRRRNYMRVSSRARRPTVMLSARTKKAAG